MRLSAILKWLGDISPLKSIEWIIAICTFAGGLYLFTPLYAGSVMRNGLSPLAEAFAHPYMILLWGAVLLVGAVLVMYGLLKEMPQIKSVGWFSIVMARFFQILTVFLITGFTPIGWIYPFTLMLVMVVLWANARAETHAKS